MCFSFKELVLKELKLVSFATKHTKNKQIFGDLLTPEWLIPVCISCKSYRHIDWSNLNPYLYMNAMAIHVIQNYVIVIQIAYDFNIEFLIHWLSN